VHELLFHREVVKDLKKIPRAHLLGIKHVLEALKLAPESIYKKPLKGCENLSSVRFGDYGIIPSPNHEEKAIYVWIVAHRGKVSIDLET